MCPFLQHVLGEFRLVPIVAGDAPPEAVAAVFDALWGGPETLIVVSTDLSHYLDYAACRRLDQSTAEAIERFDIDALGPAEACGRVPTRGLLLAARQRGMTIERLDLRNSGDTAGPRDRVVGYGAWALYEGAPPDAERAAVEALGPTLIDLVRRSIVFGLDTGQPPHVVDRRQSRAAAGRARRRLHHAAPPRHVARLHRLGGGDAAADRRCGAARLQCRVPRLAVPAPGLAGTGRAVRCRSRC